MFETAELGRKMTKADYEAALPDLRTRLLKAQAALEAAGIPVVVLLNGVGGMAETMNRLCEWMDARYLVTEAWSPPSEEEAAHPEYWRLTIGRPSEEFFRLFYQGRDRIKASSGQQVTRHHPRSAAGQDARQP